jgi:hypothetical protein
MVVEPIRVVPAEHRWLTGLAAALGRAGIPPGEAVLADGELRLAFGRPDRPALRVLVRPRGQPGGSYAATRHFAVGYAGSGRLDTRQGQVMRTLVALLGRHEAHMPRELAGHAVIAQPAAAAREQLGRLFPFVTVERSAVSGPLPYAEQGTIVEALVRTTSRCNQACPFCSAPPHAEPSPQVLAACLRTVAERLPGAMVSLTGGEPTLRPDFADSLAGLLAMPAVGRIQVQTNALRFADELDPGALPVDERLAFFVSLHALDAAIYDRCTGTRGRLERALAGTRRLLAAGQAVTINCVVNRANLDHLEAMVRALPATFPGPRRPDLHLSVLICPEWRPAAADFLVRYSTLAEVLVRASRAAEAAGLSLQALLGSTHASLPACMLAPAERRRGGHHELEPERESGYEDFSRPYVKAERCRSCRLCDCCLGVPAAYARAFGLDELSPLEDD